LHFYHNGLKVIPISPDINCGLAGITTFFQLADPESIGEVKKVYTFNNLVKIIEEDKHPDLFIIHLSEPIMEYNEIIPNNFGLFPYIISKVCISIKEDHATGHFRPPSRPNKTIFADVKASH
jgi:hypothetical protein